MRKVFQKLNSVPMTVKASVAYATCSVFQRCLSFITLPLFTRLLTTEEYGQYTIYQSWIGILSMFLTLNLAYGSFSKAMIKFENDRDGYISSIEGICLLLTIIFMSIYLPFRKLFNQLFELPTSIMCLMVAELLCCTGLQMWAGKKRFEYKYKLNIFITVVISLLSPLLAYILVNNYSEKGYARIFGYALIDCIIGGFFFLWNAFSGKKIINKTYWKYALGFNLPLFTYYLSQVIFNQSDRIMISHIQGKDKAALYGVAYSLAMVMTFLLNAINNSYVPWFYQKIKDNKQEDNQKVSLLILILMATFLLGVIWFAPEIILILAGEKYLEAIYVVPPVTASLLLLLYSQFFINVEFYYEEKKRLVYSSIGAALLNIVLNAIFIPYFGYVVAAYTTYASYVLFALANLISMKKTLKKSSLPDNAYNYKLLLFVFMIFLVLTIWGVLLYQFRIIRFGCLILFVVVMLVYHKKILGLYKNLFKA